MTPLPTLDEIIDKEFAKYRNTQITIMQFLLEKHLEIGTRDGLRKGEILGMRRVLLESITCRFGPIPLRLRRRIDRITSEEELLRLARQVVTAETLAGLRL